MSRAVQDLESQVAVSQDENANLSTGMEELDIQHQEAIRKLVFSSFAFIDFPSVSGKFDRMILLAVLLKAL